MKREDYRPLGEYIQIVDERNRDGAINNLVGVSFEKKIIPSIANTIGTDLSNYRIIKLGQFAYCPVTSRNGDRISIALYKGNNNAILSVAYTVFEITKPQDLDSDYLMLWVSRPEFDRYARFMSHGSVRELFSWEEMCNVMLPVPSIEEQRRIVAEYQTVERRIKNNEALIQKLEETAQAIYHHTFVEGIDENNLPEGWRMGCLGDVCELITKGTTPNTFVEDSIINYIKGESIGENHRFIESAFAHIDNETHINALKRSVLKVYDILITIAGTLGKFALTTEDILPANTNQAIGIIRVNNDFSPFFVYGQLLGGIHIEYCQRNIQQAVQANYSLATVSNIPLIIPNDSTKYHFENAIECIIRYQLLINKELIHLRKLQSLLTSKLA